MEVLITGAAGFIGSNLADKLLAEGNKVIALDNFNSYYPVELKRQNVEHNLNNPDYFLYEGDICDVEFLNKVFAQNKIDCVVHLAGQGGVRPSISNPIDYIKVNIEGTINILEEMKKNNVKKIVFSSSSSVYGNCSEDKFSEEIKTQSPISPYAATKSSCEQFLYTYSYLYDIQAVALRFFTVFGPRQRPDLAIRKFIDLIENDEKIPVYGDGTTSRDYTYIDDIVAGIIKSINYNKTNFEIFNLGAANPISLNKMIQTIEEELGKKAIVEHLPMQEGDVLKTSGSISKAQKMLDYYPKTNFKEGIKKYLKWKNEQNKKLILKSPFV